MATEDPEVAQAIKLAEENDFKKAYRKNKINGIFDIANYFLAKYHIKTIGGKHNHDLFIYDNGTYVLGENKIWREIQEMLEELATNYTKREIIDRIKALTISDRKDFEVDKNFINLNNGIYDIATGELLPHDPNFVFFYKIPIDYMPEADCPAIKKFLLEILDETDISIIQEWFGYALYRNYFIKKAIIFVGERNAGKTTLMKLFATFVGKNNVSGVSLQKISSDKFAPAQLYNKYINLYDDLLFRDIIDNGAFKMVTGGSIITGEYKFRDQFQFENYAKLTFACNKIPDVKDTSDDAYFSRWIIIHFNKEIDKPDKFLIEKISTPEELSGLLNFALEGLKRLLEKQDFSYEKEPYEIKIEMQRSGSSIAQFAQDCLEEKIGAWINKDGMYEKYVKYASGNNLRVETKEKFGRKILNYADYIIDNRKQNQGYRDTGWKNVQFKNIDLFHENSQEAEQISLKQPPPPL